jgi:uncharacterized protein (DUF1499 family)
MVLMVLTAGLPAGAAFSSESVPAGLKPCPSSPNCVSSTAKDPGHSIAPFVLYRTAAETLALLARAIETLPRSSIRQQENGYLKAEFRTRLGFVDDLELLADEARGVVHVRSASRSGYWDLGANRRRVETLRRAYTETAEKK